MSEHFSDASRGLIRFAHQLRLRAWAWGAAGALALGLGAATLCLSFGGWIVGAAPSPWLSGAWWLLTALAAGWAARQAVRSLPRLRGAGVARVLQSEDPRLAEETRSALELVQQPNGSMELVHALANSVHDRLQLLRPARLTRPTAADLQLAAGALLAGLSLLWVATQTDRGQAGLFALTHPDWLGGQVREGVWVAALELDVNPPAHVDAVARRYVNPSDLEVHAGSRVQVRVSSQMKLARASLSVGDLELPLRKDERGDWTGAWVAEEQGPVLLRGWTDGWLTDARERSLRVIADQAPRVTLSSPAQDQRVAASQRIALKFEASDDNGLAGIDLVVRGPGAQEHRQRVAAPPSGERRRVLGGEMALRAADFQVRPGDTLSLWLEASDLNRHVGPLVGHSAIRTLTVAGGASERSAPVAGLTQAREQALELLGDRLENEVPANSSRAKARYAALAEKTRTWLGTLHDVAGNLDEESAALVRGMERRVRSALSQEGALHRGRPSPPARRRAADEKAVTALEGDVLWLADLLARARVEDAEAVLEQLHAAEKRMRALLKELANTSDEASKRALLAEVARMRAQMNELMAKLRDVRGTVPSEFVNQEAMQAGGAQQDALSKLQQAIESGQVEDAEAALEALSEQLGQLEQGLGETGVALAAARFKPRSEASAKTLQQLEQLENAQRQLAEQTNEVGRQAAARGGASASASVQARKLAQQAQGLAKKLEQLGEDSISGPMAESQATAAQRLRDVADSLQRGDYFEGESMARHATAEMRGMARELEMDARMFPGQDGELFDKARRAEELREQAEKLTEQVAEAAPDLDKLLNEGDRREVREQAPPQRELARDTRSARERLGEAQGDDGLSAGAAEGLQDVEEAMRRAGQALKDGQLQDAQAHQREAMERMAQLQQDLQRQARASQPRGSRPGEEGDGNVAGDDERVAIPEDADQGRRSALRRRVLDARRGEVPAGYEQTVKHFYEELLR